jgi:hypothetical protein
MKKIYRGAFNFRQSARVMYAHAFSERQAWMIFCRRIAKIDGVDVSVVVGFFDGNRNNYSITIETEFKEESDGI